MASLEDYDEFGNYIGADLDSDDDDDEPQYVAPAAPEQPTHAPLEGFDDEPSTALMELDDAPKAQAVVLHENKNITRQPKRYGPDVETLVQEEDAQPLTEPIIAPIKVRNWVIEEKGLPETRFDKRFLLNMMSHPEMIRNVAVVGHLHHGKTALLDMLVYETHKMVWDADKPLRYTDTHPLSADRQISLKSNSLSLILQNSRGKSHLVHLLDTPGHLNFVDEAASAMRLADGVVLVVDIVEGLMVGTESIIRHAVQEGLPMVLVLNKIDRLILELRLPPADAYFKIKHTIEEVNTFLASLDPDPERRLSPEKGNVAFASTQMGWCFTLRSFAQMYAEGVEGGLEVEEFAKRLWGDVYYDADERKFRRKGEKRSFVHFVLEPVYKIYSQVLSADRNDLKQTLAGLGITLKQVLYKMDSRPLLKAVLDQFFGPAVGLVDMLVEWIPSPAEATAAKVERTYTGPINTPAAQSMLACANTTAAPTVVQITKLLPAKDAQSFRALGRVMSGVVRKGMGVRVLGEGFSADDEEDMWKGDVGDVWINEARYYIPAEEVPAGNIVMLGGIDTSITKTATLVAPPLEPADDYEEGDAYIFRPIKHMTQSVLKVAVEPISPSELPKMLSGLRSVNKSYPLLHTKVEESGEHVIVGTGELYLDCVLHDLRRVFAEIEIKVSDPVTRFCETVVETSALKCYADTPNKKNKITMIAEPLERGLAEDIESDRINMRMAPKDRGKILQERYQWDLLASRAVWAFGPDEQGPNVLLDDTLPSQVDKKMLGTVKEHIKQGFQWGTREGPLCDEPIRNVKFRILDATLAQEPIFRGGGQIVPTARRVCYSSFLMATPRLMEPIYYVEVQAPADCISAVYTVLARRRGHVTQDIPKAGSPLYTVKALIPVIDANGFETDLRTATQGQAFCLQTFDHWSIVPGDPTDSSIKLRPLEPATGQALARDLVLKTRRRKGLGDQIAVSKYLDDEFVLALSASGHADLLG
ncbi:Elongation factor Tu GTP binding domain [Ceratobasidium sp. AG-Ba]|nr:Elongation factor Tu GTP binding domain [Ceratobasidium sp. AG-Ba]